MFRSISCLSLVILGCTMIPCIAHADQEGGAEPVALAGSTGNLASNATISSSSVDHIQSATSSPSPSVISSNESAATNAPTPTPTPEHLPEKLSKPAAARLFRQALALQHGDGVVADPVKARELYFRSARAGDCRAMQNLGVMLIAGNGVSADPAEGYRWIRCAADTGDPKALFTCSLLLRVGAGTVKDPALATSMMRRSAELGYVPALVAVADDCISGENGVAKDPKRAADLLLQAANAGHDGAALRVSDIYRSGTGFPKDPAKADEWLAKAARLGNARAQFLYAHDLMVRKGPQAAYPWAKLANDINYVPSIGMLIEIKGLLTPEQISHGDREAARIKAAYPPALQ